MAKKPKKLIILVGNIGSGKSTITKRYIKEGFICVSRDGLRYMIGGGQYIFNENLEPIVWDTELYIFKQLLKKGVNIIVDGAEINRSIRERYIHLAKQYGYIIEALVLPKLSRSKCVKNRMKNPHGQPDPQLWKQVWNRFHKMYEKPKFDEGIDLITYVSPDFIRTIATKKGGEME